MNPFEYLVPFISVLVGLAVTDLATSLHRLLRARRRVKWDWLPLATALLAILSVLDIWWGLYGAREATSWTLAGFLPLAASLVVLFLLNAAALPDDVPAEGLDLRAFYESNASYYWCLFATYVFLAIVLNIGPRLASGVPSWGTLASILTRIIPNLVLIGLYLALAFIRNRLFHTVTTLVVLTFLILQWSQRSIGAV